MHPYKKVSRAYRKYALMAVCLLVLSITLTAASAFAKDKGQVESATVEALIQSQIEASAQPEMINAAVAPAGTLPVYRFFNTETGTHFYTISEEEKNYILATWPQFHLDGPAFYAYPITFTPQGCANINVTGYWTVPMTIVGQTGNYGFHMNLSQSGNSVDGTATDNSGSYSLTGTLTSTNNVCQISFNYAIGGTMPTTFAGTVVSNNSMTGGTWHSDQYPSSVYGTWSATK